METYIKSLEQQEKVEKGRLLIMVYIDHIYKFLFAKKVVTFKSFFLNFL